MCCVVPHQFIIYVLEPPFTAPFFLSILACNFRTQNSLLGRERREHRERRKYREPQNHTTTITQREREAQTDSDSDRDRDRDTTIKIQPLEDSRLWEKLEQIHRRKLLSHLSHSSFLPFLLVNHSSLERKTKREISFVILHCPLCSGQGNLTSCISNTQNLDFTDFPINALNPLSLALLIDNLFKLASTHEIKLKIVKCLIVLIFFLFFGFLKFWFFPRIFWGAGLGFLIVGILLRACFVLVDFLGFRWIATGYSSNSAVLD